MDKVTGDYQDIEDLINKAICNFMEELAVLGEKELGEIRKNFLDEVDRILLGTTYCYWYNS